MPEDRRIRKTQRAIIKATVKLLDTVPINKLTINEICSLADVSRSTFYLHYYDATDVIDQVHNEIIASISNVLDKFDYATILVNPEPFLRQIFDFVSGDLELYVSLLQNNFHSDFRRRLKGMLENKILHENSYRYRDRTMFEYSVCFLISGLVETICDNLQDIGKRTRGDVRLGPLPTQKKGGSKDKKIFATTARPGARRFVFIRRLRLATGGSPMPLRRFVREEDLPARVR